MDIVIINTIANVVVLTIMGGFLRYHMNRLKELEDAIRKLMTREEVRSYVQDQIRDKFSHIEYVLAELKLDIAEIKRAIQKEKPQ